MIFKIKNFDKLQVVFCPKELDETAAVSFEETAKNLLKSDSQIVVFDFSETKNLVVESCKVFVKFKQDLKKYDKTMASIKVPLKIVLQMKKAGIDAVFQPVKNLSELCKKYNISLSRNTKIDVNLINPFIMAISEYFKKTKIPAPVMKSPRVKVENEEIQTGLIASINLINSTFNGSLRAIFEKSIALSIFNAIHDKKLTDIDDDVICFYGEFLKSIFTSGAELLKQKGFSEVLDAYPSIYEVTTGANIYSSDFEVSIILDFETNFGNFTLEIVSNG